MEDFLHSEVSMPVQTIKLRAKAVRVHCSKISSNGSSRDLSSSKHLSKLESSKHSYSSKHSTVKEGK